MDVAQAEQLKLGKEDDQRKKADTTDLITFNKQCHKSRKTL